MQTPLITEDFLLQNDKGRLLYHNYAEQLPIIDYHNHLPPAEIAEDRKYDNLTQIWLAGDHYKWRAMRTNGVDEKFCTGDASDKEKFMAWAETVPKTLMNPLYHWTHMELAKPFGINDRLLDSSTAEAVWEECKTMLARDDFSVRGLLKKWSVNVVCTTDDPVDSLGYHKAAREDETCDIRVLPAFRPDKAMFISDPAAYNDYVDRLEEAADMEIGTYRDLVDALENRHDFFHSMGCRLSDQGLEQARADEYTQNEVDRIFRKVRGGGKPDSAEVGKFQSALLHAMGRMNSEKGWVQQFHLGALRNNNTRMFNKLGPDTGFDSMGDFEMARPLSAMLDRQDRDNMLPKTILYNNNPKDNALFATMIGNFQDGSVPGKIQWGSGWWFLDQKEGIEDQLVTLSNMGLLSRFVGMLTDSRSFLSFSRHEYFRRVLCNLLGDRMEKGLLPDDEELVGGMVQDICYNNAEQYFQFPE